MYSYPAAPASSEGGGRLRGKSRLGGYCYHSQSLLLYGLSLEEGIIGAPASKVHDNGLVPLPMARFLNAAK